MKKERLVIVSNNNIGSVQSGSDTIYLAFIKYWSKKIDITLWGSQESLNLLKKNRLNVNFIKTDSINKRYQSTIFNLILHNLRRLSKGLISFFKNINIFKKSNYCYTTSDFLPDFIFGLLYKKFFPRGNWLCGYYLIASSPKSPNSPYKKETIKNYFYYYIQKITLNIANKYADTILVTSYPDKKYFPNKKIVVVQGGVDITSSEKYLKFNKNKLISNRKFDAVFLGRLHPQKGVLGLVDIWKFVVQKNPNAKLAIIGDGLQKNKIISKIKKNKLTKNITMFGFKFGQTKYDIFKDSKIVVHPATYDSGGMSAAEAMAWGLPGVSYNLEALKSYYPRGMIKTPCFDQKKFSENIIKLLSDKKTYNLISSQALELIKREWDWNIRSKKIYQQIFNKI